MRTLAAVCVLALPVSVAVAGCGGDSEEEDPQAVLQETFGPHDTEVTSGVIDLSLDASAEDQGSLSASLTGPFQMDPDNPDAMPQLDLTLDVSGEGTGESVDFRGGLVITEDSAFVEYNDRAYEVPAKLFERVSQSFEQAAAQADTESGQSFSESCQRALEQTGGDASACEIDFNRWLADLTNEGAEDVEGTDTVHVHGDANVERILADITGLIEAAAPAGSAKMLELDELAALGPAISEAAIDVYSGEEDDIPRRLEFSGALDPGATSGLPLPKIDLDVSATLSEMNEEQTIEAPADAASLQDLLSEHGIDLSRLGGVPDVAELKQVDDDTGKGDDRPGDDGPRKERPENEGPDDNGSDAGRDDSGGGGGDDDTAPEPGTGDSGSSATGAGGLFGTASGLSKREQRVLDCISQATNVDELEQCNSLLEQ